MIEMPAEVFRKSNRHPLPVRVEQRGPLRRTATPAFPKGWTFSLFWCFGAVQLLTEGSRLGTVSVRSHRGEFRTDGLFANASFKNRRLRACGCLTGIDAGFPRGEQQREANEQEHNPALPVSIGARRAVRGRVGETSELPQRR